MRAIWVAILLVVPALAFADVLPVKPKSGGKKPAKTKATPTPTPEPEAELDPETAAQRDELLASAKSKSNMAEFLEARDLYRKALALDPDSADARAGLASTEKECLENARHQIKEAKVFKSAFNNAEAMRALELALKYADDVKYAENKTARDMMAAIKRETER